MSHSLHVLPQEALKTHAGVLRNHITAYSGIPSFPRRPQCKRCSLYAGAYSVCIPTAHVRDSIPPAPSVPAVVVIGQNPGVTEDIDCLPFVGMSGYILHYCYLGGIHLDRLASIYCTNAVRCLTPQNSKPSFTDCIAPCFAYTLADLESILATHTESPVCLLCVGAPAISAVWRLLFSHPVDLAMDEAFSRNGQSYIPTNLSVRRPLVMFHTYHPAHWSRSPNTGLDIHRHMTQLQNFLLGRAPAVSKPWIVPPFSPDTLPGAHTWDSFIKEMPPPPTPLPPVPIDPSTLSPTDDIPF